MYRQITDERAHFGCSHFAGMTLGIKENIALDPFAVSSLGAQQVMLEAHHFAQLVQEFEFRIGNKAVRWL